MSTEEKEPITDEKEAEHLRSLIYNKICKNAGVSIEEFMTEDIAVLQYRIVLDDAKCKNERRNGSAFCQECSDKHNKKIK